MLLSSSGFDSERLVSHECISSLEAPFLKQDKDRLNTLLPGRLYGLYELVEGFVTILDRDDVARKSESVDMPPLFFDIRIVRGDGGNAAPGEIGEIVDRGAIMITRYYKWPDLASETIHDGWIYSDGGEDPQARVASALLGRAETEDLARPGPG